MSKRRSSPGPSKRDASVIPLSSTDVTKPLLSTASKNLPSNFMSNMRKSVVLQRKMSMAIDPSEFALQNLKLDHEDKGTVSSTKNLLSSVRSLPSPMSEKRRIRHELLRVAPAEEEFLNLPIDAFCKRVKEKIRGLTKQIMNNYTLWSSSFKVIEGRFGTGVVSYFVFLRWLLLLNFVMFIITFVFVVLPQVIGTQVIVVNITSAPQTDIFDSDLFDRLPDQPPTKTSNMNLPTSHSVWSHLKPSDSKGLNNAIDDLGSLLDVYAVEGFLEASLLHSEANYSSKSRITRSKYCSEKYKNLLKSHEKNVQSHVQALFEGSGWMEDTTLLAGHYAFEVRLFAGGMHYNIAVAFLVVLLVLVTVNIIMMLAYTSEGVQESMLEKLQEMYCYVVFCGWDFCIEEPKAATNLHNSIFQDIISMLAECRRKARQKQWTTAYQTRIYAVSAIIYLATLLILVATYYLIYYASSLQLHAEKQQGGGIWSIVLNFLPSLTITGLNFLVPLILAMIMPFEELSYEELINQILIRVVLLREASIVILLGSFYNQITCEPKDLCGRGLETCKSPPCWETYVGQQLYRLTIMDFFVHLAVTFAWESPRMYVLKKWKNKFTVMLGKPLFDIPTQVLSLVYSQTLAWLGMFYCPLLPAVTVLKMIIFFYLKKFTVLKNCVPYETAYKASRSNAIFVIVLMLSYFMSIGILGYSITQIPPSPGCSPFRYYDQMVHALAEAVQHLSPEFNTVLIFSFSPLVAVPVIVLLCLTLYYYVTKSWAHKKMVQLLKVQLTMEGKDKQFLLQRVTNMRPRPSR